MGFHTSLTVRYLSFTWPGVLSYALDDIGLRSRTARVLETLFPFIAEVHRVLVLGVTSNIPVEPGKRHGLLRQVSLASLQLVNWPSN